MRLLHDLAKTHASFDDPNLVSRAGLVPLVALAQSCGLGDLTAGHVRIGRRAGVNADLKVSCLVAGMAAGADSIDDLRCPYFRRRTSSAPSSGRRPGGLPPG